MSAQINVISVSLSMVLNTLQSSYKGPFHSHVLSFLILQWALSLVLMAVMSHFKYELARLYMFSDLFYIAFKTKAPV